MATSAKKAVTPPATTSKAVAKPAERQVELFEQRPAFLPQTGGNRGNENVTMGDLIVPRIELVQPLSPCKDPTDARFIEGAVDGQIFNTVTRKLYGDAVTIVPVLFRKTWLLFRSRKSGGGFRGSYNTAAEADAARTLRVSAGEAVADLEIVEAAEHLVLVVGENGLEQAMLTCTKTKLKPSRALNSFVQLRGDDRFASAYQLSSVREKNTKGDMYFNFSVRAQGYVEEKIYKAGLKLWESVNSGERIVTTDMSDLDADEAQGQRGEM